MQQKYPGVALSVKTRQAIRAVLNHCRTTFEQLREGGVLEEHDVDVLSQVTMIKGVEVLSSQRSKLCQGYCLLFNVHCDRECWS